MALPELVLKILKQKPDQSANDVATKIKGGNSGNISAVLGKFYFDGIADRKEVNRQGSKQKQYVYTLNATPKPKRIKPVIKRPGNKAKVAASVERPARAVQSTDMNHLIDSIAEQFADQLMTAINVKVQQRIKGLKLK